VQSYNHGRNAALVEVYASVPGYPALGYIGCQDTGLAAHDGALGWRELMEADADQVAAIPGPAGLSVFAKNREPWLLMRITDTGSVHRGPVVTTGSIRLDGFEGMNIDSTTRLVVDLDQ
jgi:hypothetical protein